MKVKRPGKCAECGVVVLLVKEFDETIDMFGDRPAGTLTPDQSQQIKAWRAQDMFCEAHK